MTPETDALIARVLAHDAAATPGPWTYETWPRTGDGRESPSIVARGFGVLACDGPENGPMEENRGPLTEYRTAAPKLARMLRVTLSAIDGMSAMEFSRDAIVEMRAKVLAEIEKIAREGA